ncbi:hypothetical protein [Pseudobacillus wudalianchiensis]|nr:hypothetical protein [Bacillus wudalianchiensis]
MKEHFSIADKEKLAAISVEKEKLSRRDILELMGTNRDTYKRVRGSIKRK